jgi:hypothetical protein
MAERRPPKPLIFPIKFKICLRLAIGGRLHKTRLTIFRKFWCDQLKGMADYHAHYNQPCEHSTDDTRLAQANLMIDKFTREGVDERWFDSFKNDIRGWRKRNLVRQRKNARAARSLKFHRIKILLFLQNRIVTLRRAETALSFGKSELSLKGKQKKVHSRRTKGDIS